MAWAGSILGSLLISKTLKKLDNLQLEFEVLNALTAPDKNSRVIVNTKI